MSKRSSGSMKNMLKRVADDANSLFAEIGFADSATVNGDVVECANGMVVATHESIARGPDGTTDGTRWLVIQIELEEKTRVRFGQSAFMPIETVSIEFVERVVKWRLASAKQKALAKIAGTR